MITMEDLDLALAQVTTMTTMDLDLDLAQATTMTIMEDQVLE